MNAGETINFYTKNVIAAEDERYKLEELDDFSFAIEANKEYIVYPGHYLLDNDLSIMQENVTLALRTGPQDTTIEFEPGYMLKITSDNVIVRGLDFLIEKDEDGAKFAVQISNNRKNITLEDNNLQGIFFQSGAQGVIIKNNRIYDALFHGIMLNDNTHITIIDTHIYDCAWEGIIVDQSSEQISITNNIIENNEVGIRLAPKIARLRLVITRV